MARWRRGAVAGGGVTLPMADALERAFEGGWVCLRLCLTGNLLAAYY